MVQFFLIVTIMVQHAGGPVIKRLEFGPFSDEETCAIAGLSPAASPKGAKVIDMRCVRMEILK